MTEVQDIGHKRMSQWKNMRPLPPTTLSFPYFIGYATIAVVLLPIHLVVLAIFGIYKLLWSLVNSVFSYPFYRKLQPINPSPQSYVLVTGAASGIGKDIVSIFAEMGFSLILIDISPALEYDAGILRIKYQNQSFRHLIIDLSAETAAEEIFNTVIDKWKISDVVILINCAGFGLTGDFLNQNLKTMRTMINVNAICCMELAHHFGRYFVQRGKGRICQIASVAAYVPGAHVSVYHATKAFIRNWAVALQHELLGTGVGVTVVCPGPVRTNFVSTAKSQGSSLFGPLRWFTYSSMGTAKAAVNATMRGNREIVHGPLWNAMQNGFLSFYGEFLMMIAVKFIMQNPQRECRAAY